MKIFLFTFILLVSTISCVQKSQPSNEINGAFMKAHGEEHTNIDRIINSGELIVTTLSGPETYFDYQGFKLGLQYALVENFAKSLGVRVRVELATDTTDMIKKLKNGDVDIIAFQLPKDLINSQGLIKSGTTDVKTNTSWAIRKDEHDLSEELTFWYNQDIEIVINKIQTQRLQARHQKKRKINAPFISREKGIISIYDNLFKRAAQQIGWDWKLFAAQCYQESGFDPNATSYMGAQGLMQIMPATAEHLQLSQKKVYVPSDNITAATQYLLELQNRFKYIHNTEEQIKFILAAYNGGFGHITDAQALAKKYSKDPNNWKQVSYFVQKLSNPEYYRDPVVKYGYMIGHETNDYVRDILKRWKMYGGNMSEWGSHNFNYSVNRHSQNRYEKIRRKPNKFSKEQKIYSLDELSN